MVDSKHHKICTDGWLSCWFLRFHWLSGNNPPVYCNLLAPQGTHEALRKAISTYKSNPESSEYRYIIHFVRLDLLIFVHFWAMGVVSILSEPVMIFVHSWGNTVMNGKSIVWASLAMMLSNAPIQSQNLANLGNSVMEFIHFLAFQAHVPRRNWSSAGLRAIGRDHQNTGRAGAGIYRARVCSN